MQSSKDETSLTSDACAGGVGGPRAEGLPVQPWASEVAEVLRELETSPESGLSPHEVRRRRHRYGANCLPQAARRSAWAILLEQFKTLVVLLLVAAGAVSFAFGQQLEGFAVAAVVVINAAIGFATELRAARSMEALQRMGQQSATVRRAGNVKVVPARALVPGDVVVLDAGDLLGADLRLIETSKLQADESTLTGESAPVDKQVEAVPAEAPLAERASMVYQGTAVTRGAGEGVVVGTGLHTEIGRIATLTGETKEQETPLEKRLDQLGQRLVWVTLVIAAFVLATGVMRGKDLFLMIETAIALAVATIPEGLPIVATSALARGMLRMARRNALINRLSAVETLGATDIICTDKTGTLTENRMTVRRLVLDDETIEVTGGGFSGEGAFFRDGEQLDLRTNEFVREALKVAVLCNHASLNFAAEQAEERSVGDPMEVALLVAGAKADLDRKAVLETAPEAAEHAFDPDLKMMSTVHRFGERYLVAVKGAPEAVLDASAAISTRAGNRALEPSERDEWLERNRQLAEDGFRVLALASKTVDRADTEPYEDLEFVGLVGLIDPPRSEVKQPISEARSAGIRVIMVTGDQAPTARNVARSLGLVPQEGADVVSGEDLRPADQLSAEERERLTRAAIFARVSPEQKLHLVDLHQSNNSVVAMTGDGVNDAPALKRADIGIAMGRRGTQVAREASDMVLLDDAFGTIIFAVQQGRVIFQNIRRFVLYLLSCNVAEVLVVALASLVNAPLPILPLQILFLNLVTDVFPALALGFGEGDPAVMRRPPRSLGEPILTRRHWGRVAAYGLVIGASVLAALAVALLWLRMDTEQAVTVSFLTLAFAQLWHVFNMRDSHSGLARNDVMRNPYVWGALALCTVLLLAAVYVPFLAGVMKVVAPGVSGWFVIIAMSLLPYVAGQTAKLFAVTRTAA
ncbi:MAG: cation-transporting P-type ATPase [Armatimonadetes bacterium]|nr:cation-transporting P-type ATPase [Armatimonadota bacterium]